MSNPAFSSNEFFGDPKQRKRKAANASNRGAGTAVYDANGRLVSADQAHQLQMAYDAPSASPIQTGRLTYDDVIVKTAIMLGLIVVAGAVTWSLPDTMTVSAMVIGSVGALVFGLVNVFKREPSPVLIVMYSVLEGMLLGGFSKFMEASYPGIVIQAVIATVATFGVVLALYSSGKYRASAKATKFFMVAMISYLVFSLANWALVAFGVIEGGGMNDVTVLGIPLGLIIGIVAVLLATYSFVLDFTYIQRGVQGGAPAKYAWTAAFGLVLTLVWLYIQFVRILSYFYSD